MAPCKSVEESDFDMRKRLVHSLSQSFPGSALSMALHSINMNDDGDEQEDKLSSSCFAEVRLDKGPPDEEDELDSELTSLNWLHDANLLRNIDTGECRICESPTDDMSKENNENAYEVNGVMHRHQGAHPTNVPYNPRKHVNSKPPYSFSCLIFMAIEDSPFKRLPVKDIYAWIVAHFPYFQNAPTGWKNSVRHNLSLNKCFKKVDKEKGQSIGKGSLWCIDPDYRPNLLQALRKTPYHPFHQLQILASPQSPMTTIYPNQKIPLAPKVNFGISPHLFPFLSKRLQQSPSGSELDLDIDVANTLMSLKGSSPQGYSNPRLKPLSLQFESPNGDRLRKKLRHSPYNKKRPTSPVVITSSPSEDHTYSASSSPYEAGGRSPASSSSIDEEYDFGSDESEEEYEESDWEEDGWDSEDEKKRIVEGADALLNLAGVATSSVVSMRSISPPSNNNCIKQEIKQEICT